VDIHRLSQHPIKRDGKTVHRSIIVKLLNMSDKSLLFKNAKNLKAYNAQIQQDEEESPYVFITKHLPEKFKQQRKRLLPQYKGS